MPRQPESIFAERLGKRLKAIPCSWFCKVQMVALAGIPDYLGCVRGRFVALELKMPGGRLSALQKFCLRKISLAGGYAKVVYPDDADTVLDELSRL